MSKFKIIVGEVYRRNIKSVSFWLMIISPFLMMGVLLGIGYVSSGGFDKQPELALVTKEKEIASQMPKVVKDASVRPYESLNKAKEALKRETIDGYITVTHDNKKIKGTLVARKNLGSSIETAIQQYLNSDQQKRQMTKINITKQESNLLQIPAQFTVEKVKVKNGKVKKDQKNQSVQTAISFGLVILIFFVIISYASIIAQEVASEKGTRIMEVILSSTTAQTHFYGKITGILFVALTQFAIYIVSFSVAFPFLKKQAFIKDVFQHVQFETILNSVFLFNLFFFFFGVLAYSVLAALCGSLVSKTEDVPKAITPITYLGLIGYLIGITVGTNNPQSILVKVSSFIPFLSSFTMPVRIASDTVDFFQLSLSLVLLIVSTLILLLFSAKMYKANVLVYSEGGLLTSLKQSFTLMKSEREK